MTSIDPSYNKLAIHHAENFGFPAGLLLIKNAGCLEGRQIVPFLNHLDEEESKLLREEDFGSRQGNLDWKNVSEFYSKIGVIGLLTMFGGAILSGANSRFVKVLSCGLIITGSSAWAGGLAMLTHYGNQTNFFKVTNDRLLRLSEKVSVLQKRISNLENNLENAEEIEQLNLALNYFKDICTKWDGRIITDERLPIGSYIRVNLS